MKKLILLSIMMLTSTVCLADPPTIYDSQTGKYLGKLGGSQYVHILAQLEHPF
jgi:hypothetical protein